MTGRFGRPRGSPASPPPKSAGQRAFPPARLSRAPHSVAGQVFALQAVIVLVLIAAATLALVYQARFNSERDARNRSLAAAEAFAHAPGLPQALKAPNPTTELQPLTEAARLGSGVDFIAVMTTDGIRYTDARPNLIGRRATGDLSRAVRGEAFTEVFKGTPSDAVRAVVPVQDKNGNVVGLVGTGIEIENVSDVVRKQLPLLLGAAAGALVLGTGGAFLVSRRLRRQTRGLGEAEMTRMNEHHEAVLHAVREGVLIIDAERRLLLANDEGRRLLDLPADAEGRHVGELGLDPRTAALLASGRVATDEVHLANNRLLAVNVRPTKQYAGMPSGSVMTLRDTTELASLSGRAEVARGRLQLLYEAGVSIGTTLDVVRTAEELSEVAVPRFADFVTVELLEPVLHGEEPSVANGVYTEMRRAAMTGIRTDQPLQPVGDVIRFVVPTAPMSAALDAGRAVLAADLNEAFGWRAQDHEGTRIALDYGLHSLISVPLQARGVVLGMANFWRADTPEAFDEEDLSFAEELGARAAVSIDNARRYTREHATAVALQRSLLPRVLPDLSAVDVAFRYLPAKAGVGGDWFDVIPLPGARVALVVGDVVGHGVHAAATMGRLRTAVHNFSTLDLPPDELLGHLDELIDRIDQNESAAGAEGRGEQSGVTGATCLYAVYDPVSGRCTMASAGHPGPALVHPDGRVEFPELPAGLPLGVGGMPFEKAELSLPERSRLVLFTDGLLEDRDRDFDTGQALLRRTLEQPGRSPDQACADVLAALLFPAPSDDIALLVADTRRLEPDRIAEWEVPGDPSAVSRVRNAGSAQLTAWGLEDIAFTTELILSELITNAIRYGNAPVRVRLLRDRTLICEVSDGSSTSPHLRYAATTDEGGRGLFLVAQYADRWGTRYTERGKVIWAEVPLTGGSDPAATALDLDALEDLAW
ncbi:MULTISPECIES: SpoIIE family protein phosphatase [unclassified Streptomyces]|uniref:SpoIIE family protein phosphatase n=1 Tax=unclassified Streptomyces TaxID=2593676 RepID=UPI00224D7B92|nr:MULTISPECIES: SpoIIE family protein phosphatase [unclassified Streptomyces]MCX4528883.1 SpoIIE family protein phosphatase [Streptomyces sp. NBC_01551]MCX4540446.1 SpoIIE family protein phosphatase [Streptomyces sp. NBC_01565]